MFVQKCFAQLTVWVSNFFFAKGANGAKALRKMLVKLTSRLLTHGLHLERGVNGEGADEARTNDDDESALHLVNVWKNTKKLTCL